MLLTEKLFSSCNTHIYKPGMGTGDKRDRSSPQGLHRSTMVSHHPKLHTLLCGPSLPSVPDAPARGTGAKQWGWSRAGARFLS